MKKIFLSVALMIIGSSFGLSILNSNTALAAGCASEGVQLFRIPAWYRGLVNEGTCEIKKVGPKDSGGEVEVEQFIWTIIGNVFDGIVRIIGVVATGYIIWAGFQYMIAAGDTGKMANAKTTIINAVTGLIIALIASGVVQLIMGVF